QTLALGCLHLNLAQLQHDLLRTRLLTSPHVRLLWSWLILSISPVQSQPVRSQEVACQVPAIAIVCDGETLVQNRILDDDLGLAG
ncbi:hypothetical protein U2053_14650, partial [Listeria monocytogenes]|uniref:hypothetical protein n=1 Tax=Listeria monocytogenes TaxID=1639 RepID=UPI002FDB9C94